LFEKNDVIALKQNRIADCVWAGRNPK